MVHAYFRVTGTHESIFDVSDLMGVTLWGPLLWVSLTHRPVRCGLLAVIYGRYTAKACTAPQVTVGTYCRVLTVSAQRK